MTQDRCFACGRNLTKVGNPYLVGCEDDQTAFVGPECFKKIKASGEQGYQPPEGGPRLYLIEFTKHASAE